MSNAPRLRFLSLAAAVLLAACTTTIDGQEVGGPVCGDTGQLLEGVPCDAFAHPARSQLDVEQPGHAPIRDVVIYRDLPDEGFGPPVFVLLRLDDGTDHLYRVRCTLPPERNVICFAVAREPKR
jgi:hypothetical protein